MKMRWFGIWWLTILAAVIVLDGNKSEAAPNPQAEDMLNTLLKLDRMYSSVARPRFGKRTQMHHHYPDADYEAQFQNGDASDWLPVRR